MRTSFTTALAATLISSASAYVSGFNLGSQIDGHCRTESDWEFAFNKIASFPGDLKNVRVYTSSDCSTLVNAIPPAIRTGTKLLAGVWTEDDTHYQTEKQALQDAIQSYGCDWILSVSVGVSEVCIQAPQKLTFLSPKISTGRILQPPHLPRKSTRSNTCSQTCVRIQ